MWIHIYDYIYVFDHLKNISAYKYQLLIYTSRQYTTCLHILIVVCVKETSNLQSSDFSLWRSTWCESKPVSFVVRWTRVHVSSFTMTIVAHSCDPSFCWRHMQLIRIKCWRYLIAILTINSFVLFLKLETTVTWHWRHCSSRPWHSLSLSLRHVYRQPPKHNHTVHPFFHSRWRRTHFEFKGGRMIYFYELKFAEVEVNTHNIYIVATNLLNL